MAKTLGVRSRRPMPQMADMKHHQFFSVYVYGRNDLKIAYETIKET